MHYRSSSSIHFHFNLNFSRQINNFVKTCRATAGDEKRDENYELLKSSQYEYEYREQQQANPNTASRWLLFDSQTDFCGVSVVDLENERKQIE